jgi:hypothetical protein
MIPPRAGLKDQEASLKLRPLRGSCVCQRAVDEYSSASGGSITRLRFGRFCEPPCAVPHAGWCGEGELKAPLYPIMRYQIYSKIEI